MTALRVRAQMQGVKRTFADVEKRINEFATAERRARTAAAKVATRGTRANFHYRREPIDPRPGRSSTGGQMRSHLQWVTTPDGKVEFDIKKADAEVPHWIIQDLGTGKRAVLKHAAAPNPVGRPKKGATYVRTVRSQKGRRIRGGLVFASGGQFSPTGSRRDEQLHWASTVTGVPFRVPAVRITKEIRGQHFVERGAEAGFSEYRQSVLGAARQAFGGKRP